MTGRRLYDLWCDGWFNQGEWSRNYAKLVNKDYPPPAWPFLSNAEKKSWSHAAARSTPKKKAAA